MVINEPLNQKRAKVPRNGTKKKHDNKPKTYKLTAPQTSPGGAQSLIPHEVTAAALHHTDQTTRARVADPTSLT